MKEKKKLYQQWWFLLCVVLIVLFCVYFFIHSKNSGVGSAGISLKEFEEIEIGKTTNFELYSIIDKNDEWNNEKIYNKCVEIIEETKSNHKYTYVYKYYGEISGYAIITLQADYSNGYFYNDVIVIKKENYNLR